MEKSLQMVFKNAAGKNVTITVQNVKDDITQTQIKSLMDVITSKNIFTSQGGDIVSSASASIVTRGVETVAVK